MYKSARVLLSLLPYPSQGAPCLVFLREAIRQCPCFSFQHLRGWSRLSDIQACPEHPPKLVHKKRSPVSGPVKTSVDSDSPLCFFPLCFIYKYTADAGTLAAGWGRPSRPMQTVSPPPLLGQAAGPGALPQQPWG